MVIEIVSIILFPKCSVMENPDIQLLYVEYCFLGYCGADMETISVRKPQSPDQKLTYNFRKSKRAKISLKYFLQMEKKKQESLITEFRVDTERHRVQDSILRSMLSESINPSIKFIIVCEPIPEEIESKECIEVG